MTKGEWFKLGQNNPDEYTKAYSSFMRNVDNLFYCDICPVPSTERCRSKGVCLVKGGRNTHV